MIVGGFGETPRRLTNTPTGFIRWFLSPYLLLLKSQFTWVIKQLCDYSRKLFQCVLLAILLAAVKYAESLNQLEKCRRELLLKREPHAPAVKLNR